MVFLPETVFMDQPNGISNPKFPNHICKLNKALYGLKQAPRAWFSQFNTYLKHFGFKCSLADPSLFIYNYNSDMLIVLLYVDDIILTGSNQALITTFIRSLPKEFDMKDIGYLHYFLGV